VAGFDARDPQQEHDQQEQRKDRCRGDQQTAEMFYGLALHEFHITIVWPIENSHIVFSARIGTLLWSAPPGGLAFCPAPARRNS
jgi:hypothetical protein